MAQRWHFIQDAHSQWRWTRVDDDDHHVESATSFPDQATCTMDAIRFAVAQRRVRPLLDETTPTAERAPSVPTETGNPSQPH
jgi:hypothetical protein